MQLLLHANSTLPSDCLMLIFLDIDGVLHPIPTDDRGILCHLPSFESLLKSRPDLRVVLSSSWREEFDFDTVLVEMFSEEFRSRVLGVTPVLAPDCTHPHRRWKEIQQWLKAQAYAGPWLALDDNQSEFPPDCAQVIFCDKATGLDQRVLARVKTYLDDWLQAPVRAKPASVCGKGVNNA